MLILFLILIMLTWFLMELARRIYHIVYLVRISLLFDSINSKEDLLFLRKRDFEYVVAEIFKRSGYRVRMSDHFGEGGTGIILNDILYVQARKERYQHLMEIEQAKKLAKHMRENGIYRGMLITLGDFKNNTKNFCHLNVIKCINGNQLLQMCKDVQSSGILPLFVRF
ncbi:MAG TPA: restriction endonuclease [Ruminiclostridium sp.]|mgnify:FL=1|nr:restriction endonuclease [Clostridiaceae bacterium]HAA24875.1 restriction endonuclease [Ruminiclostridium sp.]